MKNKKMMITILVIVIIAIISVVVMIGQEANNEKTIEFNEANVSKKYQSNDEIADFSSLYCEYYNKVLSLYNKVSKDNFVTTFDHYEEYEDVLSYNDKLSKAIEKMEFADNISLAYQMQLKVTTTNLLLTRLNLDLKMDYDVDIQAEIDDLHESIVDGYNFISSK